MIKILSIGYPSSSYGGPYYVANLFKKILNKDNIYVRNTYIKKKIIKYYFFHRKKINKYLSNFDIIHIHNIWSIENMVLAWLASRIGIPYIISTHGNLNNWSMKNKNIIKIFFLFLFKKTIYNSRAFHILNKFEEEEISNNLETQKLKIFLLQNYIDLSKINFIKKNDLPFKVLFFGRLTEKKGIFEFLKIIELFSIKNIKNIKFLFVGPKDEKFFLKFLDKINQYKINHLVEIRDKIEIFEEKKKLFYESDIFVLPSKDEADSISVKEALAFGRPVVISNNCKFNSNFENKEFVKLITKFDKEKYFDAIMEFYNDKIKLIDNGEKIHSYAKNNYSIELIENELSQIYYDCISYTSKSKFWKN